MIEAGTLPLPMVNDALTVVPNERCMVKKTILILTSTETEAETAMMVRYPVSNATLALAVKLTVTEAFKIAKSTVPWSKMARPAVPANQ